MGAGQSPPGGRSPPLRRRACGAAAAYLRRVAHNRFIDECRRRRTRPALRELDGAEAYWMEYAGDDDGESYRDALRQCMSRLTERARQVLALFYGEGLSREAIGTRCLLTPDGVKTAMRRSRALLRDCIRGELS